MKWYPTCDIIDFTGRDTLCNRVFRYASYGGGSLYFFFRLAFTNLIPFSMTLAREI
nr:MAG TPA: hypothetical protein [Bacteriophage sp.]